MLAAKFDMPLKSNRNKENESVTDGDSGYKTDLSEWLSSDSSGNRRNENYGCKYLYKNHSSSESKCKAKDSCTDGNWSSNGDDRYYQGNTHTRSSKPINIVNSKNLPHLTKKRSRNKSFSSTCSSSSVESSHNSSASSLEMWKNSVKTNSCRGNKQSNNHKHKSKAGNSLVEAARTYYALPKYFEAPSPETLPLPPLHWYKPGLKKSGRTPSTVDILEALFSQCSFKTNQSVSSIPLNTDIESVA